MRVYYRRGLLAMSLDASGQGFAYRRDSSVLLRQDRKGGSLLDRHGAETQRWDGLLRVDRSDTSPSFAAALDEHLGLLLRQGVPSIAFCVDGVRSECVYGVNLQVQNWDDEDTLLASFAQRPQRRDRDRVPRATPAPGGATIQPGLAGIQDALAMLPALKVDARGSSAEWSVNKS